MGLEGGVRHAADAQKAIFANRGTHWEVCAGGTGTFLPPLPRRPRSSEDVKCGSGEERAGRGVAACRRPRQPGPPALALPREHSSCVSSSRHDPQPACWQPSVGNRGERTGACPGSHDWSRFRWGHGFIQSRGERPGCPGQLERRQEDFSLPCSAVTPTALSRLVSSFIHSLINPALLSASFALLFYGHLPHL